MKVTQTPGAAEQMLEMRSREHDRKVPRGAQDVVANPSPVQLNSLLASRGFWSSPPPHSHVHNMCINLSMCLGGAVGSRLLLFCHVCFQFFFPLLGVWLIAVTEIKTLTSALWKGHSRPLPGPVQELRAQA